MKAAVALISVVSAFAGRECEADTSTRQFTVADDIEMSQVQGGPVISPDGKYFCLITQRGVLDKNIPEYSLWVWSTDEVARFARDPLVRMPAPILLARVNNYKDGPMNGMRVRWLDDSSGIAYVALNAAGNFQLFETDLKTRTTQTLSSEDRNVTGFDVQGRNYVYTVTSPEIVAGPAAETQPQSADITGQSLFQLLFPLRRDPESLRFFPYSEVWATIQGKRWRVENARSHKPVHVYSSASAYSEEASFSLSPDGRSLAVIHPVASAPQYWDRYAAPTGYENTRGLYRFGTAPEMQPLDGVREQVLKICSYQLLDLSSGLFSPLANAPTGRLFGWHSYFDAPRWSADGQALLLSNSFLLLDVANRKEQEEHVRHPCVAVFDLRTRELSCVLPLIAGLDKHRFGVEDARFDQRDRHRIIIHFTAGGWLPSGKLSAVYRLNARGDWTEETGGEDPVLEAIPVEVIVQQDLNHPPVLIAIDKATKTARTLWDPNPQFRDRDWGEASIITWKDKTAWEYTADLVKPPGFAAGKRYPLVIQTHGHIAQAFLASGVTTTGFAARELAAAGILVVQMDWNGQHFGEAQEGDDQVEGFSSLVTKLDHEGLIAPDKVGLVGWSRSVYHTYAALAADRPRLAAASVIEGVNYGYWEYMNSVDESSHARDSQSNATARMIGAAPVGAGLQLWFKHSPIFNLDRVSAPLLMLETGKEAVLADWEPYAALYSLNKPVDLILLPSGSHVQTNPRQRLASQGTTVDWFRFWLQSFEDPDPAKTEQYRRWEQLCDMQVTQNPNQPAFCVRTKTH